MPLPFSTQSRRTSRQLHAACITLRGKSTGSFGPPLSGRLCFGICPKRHFSMWFISDAQHPATPRAVTVSLINGFLVGKKLDWWTVKTKRSLLEPPPTTMKLEFSKRHDPDRLFSGLVHHERQGDKNQTETCWFGSKHPGVTQSRR